MIRLIWQCLFSPRLYNIYRDGTRESLYQPQSLEKWGDKIISIANAIVKIGYYTSPVLCLYFYKRGNFLYDDTRTYVLLIGGVACILAFSFLIRSIGRATNPKYIEFLQALSTNVNDKKKYLEAIRKYDFDFYAWPLSYTVSPKKSLSWFDKHPFRNCANENLPAYQRVVLQVLAFLATHTFGLRLIYPGSLGLVHKLLWVPVMQGRTQLVESFDGQRTKIGTADGNSLDTMFVDNRSKSPKGKTLVICCEGNAGFYEIGIMTTPIKAGYSALGWNHPGFAESTGSPYPEQEKNAIDTVMQYAINELGFKVEDIVLFGWSIGGYSATWAAVNYPDVKALVLDATFDDLLPLAENQMPSSWSLLVKEVVRSYVNLNILELITKYPGPVQLVRRTDDEIICLRQGQLSTNRGNILALKLIEARHPEITAESLTKLTKYIALSEAQRAVDRNDLDDDARKLLKLISKYMRDYRSTHCTPLPEEHFEVIMNNVTLIKKND